MTQSAKVRRKVRKKGRIFLKKFNIFLRQLRGGAIEVIILLFVSIRNYRLLTNHAPICQAKRIMD